MRRAATSTERTASRDQRHEQLRRAGALDLEHLARRQRDHARARAPTSRSPSTTRQPSRSSAYHSSSPSGGAVGARDQQVRPAQRLGRLAASTPARRRIGRSSVPARRTISRLAAGDAHRRAERQQRAARARHVEASRRGRGGGRRGPPRATRRGSAATSVDDVDEHAALLLAPPRP